MIVVNPIYNKDFLGRELQSTEAELRKGPRGVDFSLTERTWSDTAKRVALFLVKIILFPWAIYEAVRWCMQRLVMSLMYPAQSSIAKCFVPQFKTEALDAERMHVSQVLQRYIVRHVTLEKDGSRLSGLLIGTPETINNGKWVLQAVGNATAAEENVDFATIYQRVEYNTLLINNPGVGRSEGFATPQTIGECQRTAITYLETALKAKKIVLAGYSLGGASIGEAILQHDFEKSAADFLVVRQVTFGKASEMARLRGPMFRIPACLAENIVHWTGCEMDNVASSKKLAQHQIREVIIQGERDQIIPESVSLAKSLEQEVRDNQEVIVIPWADHFNPWPIQLETIQAIEGWEANLQPLEIAE